MKFTAEILSIPLPEDILRAQMSGDIALCERLIEARISSERTSPMMKQRLEAEKVQMGRRLRRYPYTRETLIEKVRVRVPDFTGEELDKLEQDGCVDAITVNGEKRYVSCCPGTLFKMSASLRARDTQAPDPDDGADTGAFMKELKEKKTVAYRIGIKSSLKIEDEFFKKGKWTVHIPVAAVSAQQSEVTVKTDGTVSATRAEQRTACFTRYMEENTPFEAEIHYTSRIKYVDPMHDEPRIVYPGEPELCEDDLGESAPHIAFTPYLRSLAEYIAGDETRPLYLAKRIYDYITLNVRYSFMRSYNLIENHAEYTAVNMKGDCGLQALLFITLCRIMGIPARWQSGLTVNKFTTGDHDWAQFWTEEFGWLFADPSYGGGAHRNGNEEKREFYFGNLDPFRMVANRRYMGDFDPKKAGTRADMGDSQDGEVEIDGEGLDFNAFDKTDTTIEFRKM